MGFKRQWRCLSLTGSGLRLYELDRHLTMPRGERLPTMGPLDVILAADCVYFEPAFPLLVQTLEDLAIQNGKQPDFLFCYKKRRKVKPFPSASEKYVSHLPSMTLSQADRRFFSLLKKKFAWVEVSSLFLCSWRFTHYQFVWLLKVEDPDKPIYSRDAISLLRLSRI